MRALAEFIMRGRLQAALVAAVGNLVPVVSTATVGLVALRRGMLDGLLILFWAALPVIVLGSVTSGVNLLLMVATGAALLVVLLAAEVLKQTVSWSYTLLVSLLGTALATGLMSGVFPEQVSQLESALAAFFQEVSQQSGENADLIMPTKAMLLGVVAYVTLLNVVVSLLVARWWQSMLYNPGGFRSEMHGFRMQVYPAIILMAGVVGCYFYQPDYAGWASFLGLPLLMGGLCLLHYLVAATAMGVHWLVLVYVGIVLFGPLTLLLMFVGLADSLLNLRSRIIPKGDS